jgi:hypothetical protein
MRGMAMMHTKSNKAQILDTAVQITRGQSIFNNLQISWLLSETYGLTIANIRCGLCSMPLEAFAVKVGDEVYLVCEDGHLVGNAGQPLQLTAIQRQQQQFTKRHEYNGKVEELIKAFKASHAQAQA